MEFKEIEEIVRLFEQAKKVGKFHLKAKGGVEISLEKVASDQSRSHQAPPATALLHKAVQEPLNVPEKKEKTLEEAIQSTLPRILSPMVGTFYQSPSPEEPSYVSPGSKVKKGDVVCIVEAMKVMNEVKAECSGTIKEIHVKDGDPIEFESPLMTVEPH